MVGACKGYISIRSKKVAAKYWLQLGPTSMARVVRTPKGLIRPVMVSRPRKVTLFWQLLCLSVPWGLLSMQPL